MPTSKPVAKALMPKGAYLARGGDIVRNRCCDTCQHFIRDFLESAEDVDEGRATGSCCAPVPPMLQALVTGAGLHMKTRDDWGGECRVWSDGLL